MDTSEKGNRSLFVTAHEVGILLGVSRAYAYRIVKKLNEELSQKGYLTIQGKINKKYFYERIYGKEDAYEQPE